MADKTTIKPKKPEQIKKEELEKEEKDKKVQIAVRFLMNPDVANASDEVKRNFLKKKGLNDDDIDKAHLLMKEKEISLQKAAELKQLPLVVQSTVSLKQSSLGEQDLNDKIEKAKLSNTIVLRNFQITQIPATILQLDSLQILFLSFNPLTAIPDEISKLVNLRVFHAVACNLQDYQISDVNVLLDSQTFWTLPKLQELNLARNQLVYMDNLTKLQQLTILNLSNNSILQIPDNINDISSLILMDLSHNNISRLPSKIKELQKLQKLFLDDNLLDTQYHDIIRQKYNQPTEMLRLIEQCINEDN